MPVPFDEESDSSKKRIKSSVMMSSSSVPNWLGLRTNRLMIARTHPTRMRKPKNREEVRKGRMATRFKGMGKERAGMYWDSIPPDNPWVNPLIMSDGEWPRTQTEQSVGKPPMKDCHRVLMKISP